VAGWRARDVVDHLVEWLPEFLTSATGVVLDRGPSAADDPASAWQLISPSPSLPADRRSLGQPRQFYGGSSGIRTQGGC
jgi:hypothetical protein